MPWPRQHRAGTEEATTDEPEAEETAKVHSRGWHGDRREWGILPQLAGLLHHLLGLNSRSIGAGAAESCRAAGSSRSSVRRCSRVRSAPGHGGHRPSRSASAVMAVIAVTALNTPPGAISVGGHGGGSSRSRRPRGQRRRSIAVIAGRPVDNDGPSRGRSSAAGARVREVVPCCWQRGGGPIGLASENLGRTAVRRAERHHDDRSGGLTITAVATVSSRLPPWLTAPVLTVSVPPARLSGPVPRRAGRSGRGGHG
jgi:hypothetical protein